MTARPLSPTQIMELAHRIAYLFTTKSFREVELEEVAAELLLYAYQPVVEKNWTKADDPGTYLYRCLQNHAYLYCKKEQARLDRQKDWQPEQQYHYSASEVEQLVGVMLDYRADGVPPEADKVPDTAREVRLKNESGDILAMVADMAKAFDTLSDDDRNILVQRFHLGVEVDVIAKALGIHEDSVRRKQRRAVSRMLKALGGPEPERYSGDGPGSRRAMSNAEASAIVRE